MTEAPQFDLPGVDGQNHSLDSYGDAEALVLVQSCNHCPYVQAWEGRLSAIARDFADRGVRVVAVNSNDVSSHPEDSFEEMQKRASAEGFAFDYLYDEPQAVARALGAERTPEVFVYDRDRAARLPRRDRRLARGGRRQPAVPPRRARRGPLGPGAAADRDAGGRLHGQVEVTRLSSRYQPSSAV